MIVVGVVGGATPVGRAVDWGVDREAEFALEAKGEDPVVEAVRML